MFGADHWVIGVDLITINSTHIYIVNMQEIMNLHLNVIYLFF